MTDYRKGIIIICDKCGKIDIYPLDHFKTCEGLEAKMMREAIDDNMWK